MIITFLGTGTSQGVPIITCSCKVCCSNDERDRRLRSSIHIQTNEGSFVIDAGPDFRYQMLRANIKRLDAILITHSHHDHIGGLDDIRPFNYIQKSNMPIYGSSSSLKKIEKIYNYAFGDDRYPGVPDFELKSIRGKFLVKDTWFEPIVVYHGKMKIYGFKFNNAAYITDASYIPTTSLKKLRNLDVLIINALRLEPHQTHFTLSQALEIVHQLKPQKTFLTHISHQLGLYEEVQKNLPENVFLSYDMLKVEI